MTREERIEKLAEHLHSEWRTTRRRQTIAPKPWPETLKRDQKKWIKKAEGEYTFFVSDLSMVALAEDQNIPHIPYVGAGFYTGQQSLIQAGFRKVELKEG